jgi:hypothetical protein
MKAMCVKGKFWEIIKEYMIMRAESEEMEAKRNYIGMYNKEGQCS